MSLASPGSRSGGGGGLASPSTATTLGGSSNSSHGATIMPLGNSSGALSPSTSGTSASTAALLAGSGVKSSGGGMANYRVVNTIGRGNFGVCHLAECIDPNSPPYLGKQFVIKQINLSQLSASEREGAVQEARLLSELHHPFIVAYRESFLESEVLNIVMSYCEGGDLASLIKKQDGKPFSEEQILDWFIQLCLALRYIHQRHIIHRDLKSGNIFVTKKHNIRLGDLGIARVLNGTNELAMSVVGTPYSMSPEVCENKPYSFKSDIWALGCVLYELCTLKHAFDAQNLLGLVWKIVSEAYPPIPDHYSDDLKQLVDRMLSKDPAGRPTIDQILEMPFIRERLHSQIRAKMNLKSKPGSQSRKPAPSPPPPSHSQSQPITTSARGLDGTLSTGPTGTLRARPTLDVPHSAASLPGGLERLQIASPNSASFTPSPAHSNGVPQRATSATVASRAAAHNPPSARGGSNVSPTGDAPMLSPSDRLAFRKKAEADARARELSEAARASHGERVHAAQRAHAEFRGGPIRPASSIPSSSSYSSTFDEPPRQRTAGATRAFEPVGAYPVREQRSSSESHAGAYSGRTPTRGSQFDYHQPPTAAFAPPSPSPSPEDRPIKSSGSYQLGAAGAMSPAAMQAARAAGSARAAAPSPMLRDLNDSDPDLLSHTLQPARPTSSTMRVTRVQEDDDDDAYSSDDFEPLSDEESEIMHELERTYSSARPHSSFPSSSAPRSSLTGSQGRAGASTLHSASLSASSAPAAPSILAKHAAIKERCLRSMSEAEFREVYDFIASRTAEALQCRDGSKDLTKEELARKFGKQNQQIVFQIEQLVYLSDLLQKGRSQQQQPPLSSSQQSSPLHSPPSHKPSSSALSSPSGKKVAPVTSGSNGRTAIGSPAKSSATAPRTPLAASKPASAGSVTSSRSKK